MLLSLAETRSAGVALWQAEVSAEEAVAALMDAGAEPGDWILQDDIRTVSFAIFDRTFAITAVLNTLTLMVAGVALLAAMLSLHQSRLPEYARWRSLGVFYREWLFVVALPLSVMLLVTWLLALPLGLVLSWLLIHKLNVIAFGWTMDLVWQWFPVFVLGAIALVVVGVTTIIAVAQVRRTLPTAIREVTAT